MKASDLKMHYPAHGKCIIVVDETVESTFNSGDLSILKRTDHDTRKYARCYGELAFVPENLGDFVLWQDKSWPPISEEGNNEEFPGVNERERVAKFAFENNTNPKGFLQSSPQTQMLVLKDREKQAKKDLERMYGYEEMTMNEISDFKAQEGDIVVFDYMAVAPLESDGEFTENHRYLCTLEDGRKAYYCDPSKIYCTITDIRGKWEILEMMPGWVAAEEVLMGYESKRLLSVDSITKERKEIIEEIPVYYPNRVKINKIGYGLGKADRKDVRVGEEALLRSGGKNKVYSPAGEMIFFQSTRIFAVKRGGTILPVHDYVMLCMDRGEMAEGVFFRKPDQESMWGKIVAVGGAVEDLRQGMRVMPYQKHERDAFGEKDVMKFKRSTSWRWENELAFVRESEVLAIEGDEMHIDGEALQHIRS